MKHPEIDHIGIAVRSLERATKFYQQTLGLESAGHATLENEKVHVAMLRAGEPRIELLEATDEDSPVAKFVSKRGEGLHHIALKVPDLGEAVARIKKGGAQLVTDEIQPGEGGYRYAFVHPKSTGGVLLELIEE